MTMQSLKALALSAALCAMGGLAACTPTQDTSKTAPASGDEAGAAAGEMTESEASTAGDDAESGMDAGHDGGMTDADADPDGAGEEPASEQEGMISSGQAEAPPELPTPDRPAATGINQMVPLSQAAESVPFQAYEPSFVPEGAMDDVIMLISPRTGDTNPALPAINMIYTIASHSTFRVYQSPAGDRPYPEGKETTDIVLGDTPAKLIRQGLTHVVAWEVGDVRLEVHSRDIDVALLQEIAAGLRPYGQADVGDEG